MLAGSVRKVGNTIRIAAQLINVNDGFHLWSESYDRELKNVFAIQDEISQAIASALQVEILGEEIAPMVKFHTENLEAYDQYLLGRYHWNKRTVGGDELMTAIAYFEQAIALEPNYALAYSGLADAYNLVPSKDPSVKSTDVRENAEEAAKKAIALGPDLAEAHVSYGLTRQAYHFDYKGAETAFLRAIELNPKYAPAHHMYAELLLNLGRFDEALAERRKLAELEPLSINNIGMLGYTLQSSRQYNAAILQFQRILELDANNAETWKSLGIAYIYAKKFEDATQAGVRWAELAGKDKEAVKLFISLVAEHNRTGESVSLPPEIENIWRHDILPKFYAMLGQREKTLALLEQEYEEGYYWNLSNLKIEPVYDFIRSDPRFISLMKKVGL